MSSIRKKEPKPHAVFVDTNVLWFSDKTYSVNPEFDSFWDLYKREFKLELLVPEIVKSELLFQQYISAEKSMVKASVALKEASRVVESSYSHRLTKGIIRKRVEAKLNKWLKSKGGREVELPVKKIDWRAIVDASVWRTPPFVFDPKKAELEKGFRDALILETLVQEFADRLHAGKKLVFICADSLLRETADKRMKKVAMYDSYESLKDFESYLKLTREAFESDFIRAILRRASVKFFKQNNDLCLYYKENVSRKLRKNFKSYFENPEESLGGRSRLFTAMARANNTTEKWVAKQTGGFWIGKSRFEKVEETNVYYWVNSVNYVQLYRSRDLEMFPSNTNAGEMADYLLVLEFEVHWSATVTRDGRFKNILLLDTALIENSFQPPTAEQVAQWSLYPDQEK